MRITRRILIQLLVFAVVSITALMVMSVGYLKLPALLFGAGHYQVTLELPETGGLYQRGNVTYRGTKVGLVDSVRLADGGVEAILSLQSRVKIPADLDAEVHSVSAVGEQYVELSPRGDTDRVLRDGDVIPRDRASVPPDINALLDATNRGLEAIPGDNLQTAIDEAYTAVAGLGPEIFRFVKASTALATEARKNLNEITDLTDNAAPVLDSHTDSADGVRAWAAHLATVTQQLQTRDSDLADVLRHTAPAGDEVRALFDRLQPTLPTVLANLVSVAPVLVTYRDNLEQLLVLLPQGTSTLQAVGVANRHNRHAYRGNYLSFNLNLNLPPPCTTGFLPARQQRVATFVDYPDRPAGELYCRVPQDAPFNVRGARNLPCVTRPGKRAPTVELCESDEDYVPLNDGYNWKGDPNATLTGQDIPQLPPGTPGATAPKPQAAPLDPMVLPVVVAEYDPASGSYVGPDGRIYTQAELGRNTEEEQTWQTMLLPPNRK